jgi:hypothetical protein
MFVGGKPVRAAEGMFVEGDADSREKGRVREW